MLVRVLSFSLIAASGVVAAQSASALSITAATVGVTTPSGSNDTTNPYTDDVLLQSVDIGTANYATQDSFRAVGEFRILSGRSEMNAEWGDNDDGADGDDNPFVKAGFDPADQETTNPTIQDAALLNVFNTLSLTEMSDGEGTNDFSFRMLFAASLTDDDNAADDVPDIMFFERGMNDQFDVKLIIGGTFDNPLFSDTLSINSSDFFGTGISVDTTEIGGSQQIGMGGFDFNEFGLNSGETVYGLELFTSDGPDLNAFALASEDPGRFGNPLGASPVPLPAGLPLLASVIFGGGYVARRRARAKA